MPRAVTIKIYGGNHYEKKILDSYNVELADAEWKVIMDTGVATYKVYDSKGAEITVVNGVFTLGASDTVTLVFTPVGGGGVDACAIQQKK